MLGQSRDERVQRPVGVWRLSRTPDGELAADPVEVRHRAARLHWRGVRAREHHLLVDDHVCPREHPLGRSFVARLPVEDVVVTAPLLVVADHRSAGVERLARVDHDRQRLVLDIDQLERIAGRVAVVGERKRDLLPVEAHLVGREHRLRVAR